MKNLIRAAFGLITVFVIVLAILVIRSAFPSSGAPSSQATGALFYRAGGIVTLNAPVCTASVVKSKRGNLLITAAHCLDHVPVRNLVFAPYYRNGNAPYGTFNVTSQVLPLGWPHYGGTVNRDFAFLTVAGNVQRITGADTLGYSKPSPTYVTVEGYRIDGGISVCTRQSVIIRVRGARQIQFGCPGFWDAASGAPFLTGVNGSARDGTIVGVLGGYQDGGLTSSVSYASPFGNLVHELYDSVKNR